MGRGVESGRQRTQATESCGHQPNLAFPKGQSVSLSLLPFSSLGRGSHAQ